YNPGHLFGMISAINPFVVDEVSVYKGVFDPSYDNRVGGVIDLSLQDSLPTKWSGGVGSTLSEVHTHLRVPIVRDKIGLTLAGRYTLSPLFTTPTLRAYTTKVFQGTRVTDEDLIEQKDEALLYDDWNAKLSLRPTDKLLLKASLFDSRNYYFNSTDIFEDDEGGEEEEVLVDEIASNMNARTIAARYQWSDKWQTELSWARSAYDSRFFYSLEGGSGDNVFDSETFNTITENKWSAMQYWQANQMWKIELGYQQTYSSVSFSSMGMDQYSGQYEDIINANNIFLSPLAAIRYQKANWKMDMGMRVTYDYEEQDWHFSPRINTQYAINQHIKLNASAGVFQQFISQLVSFQNNEIGQDNNIWILNRQEDSDVQIGRKLSLGLVYQQKGWLFNTELFYQKNDNLDTRTNNLQRTFEVSEYISGSSTARGMDILVKKEWRAYQLWMAYSLQQVDYLFEDLVAETFPASNDQRHRFNFVNSWQWRQWRVSGVYHYRTGLPFSQPTNVGTGIDEEGEVFNFLEYATLNTNRLPAYHRLDIGLHYHLSMHRCRLETSLSLLNVLGRENLFRREYFINSQEDRALGEALFSQVDKTLLARTPQLLVRMYW
ncbi:MAG: hypothetical protein AAGK47_05930, partial [Bacteroidota bacterium]